jgi:hypothetical protein
MKLIQKELLEKQTSKMSQKSGDKTILHFLLFELEVMTVVSRET